MRISGGDGGTGADHQEVEPNDTTDNATVITMSGSSVGYAGSVETDADDFDIHAFVTGTSQHRDMTSTE